MNRFELKYGINPNQKDAEIFMRDGSQLPITIENGRPGYINFLDAFNSYQLVKELDAATGLPAAASFKHVSPAGAAVYAPLDEVAKKIYFPHKDELSPLATAYLRARGADRLCSYGDWIALSRPCDADTAEIISREVSDGVIAPGYEPEALEILRKKRRGSYNVVAVDPAYEPKGPETRDVFGITFSQGRNDLKIDGNMFENIVTKNREIPEYALRDLTVAQITLKYTQSNSVCYVKDGQTIGVGAGQQSRVHCTRLAGSKADNWYLRQHEKVLALPFLPGVSRPERDNAIDVYISDSPEELLSGDAWRQVFSERPEALTSEERRAWLDTLTGVSLGSDAFFPFADNIERARRSGVSYIVSPGGSVRDDLVIEACDDYGMVMVFTGTRLFHH